MRSESYIIDNDIIKSCLEDSAYIARKVYDRMGASKNYESGYRFVNQLYRFFKRAG